jgi:hypothetical protein
MARGTGGIGRRCGLCGPCGLRGREMPRRHDRPGRGIRSLLCGNPARCQLPPGPAPLRRALRGAPGGDGPPCAHAPRGGAKFATRANFCLILAAK